MFNMNLDSGLFLHFYDWVAAWQPHLQMLGITVTFLFLRHIRSVHFFCSRTSLQLCLKLLCRGWVRIGYVQCCHSFPIHCNVLPMIGFNEVANILITLNIWNNHWLNRGLFVTQLFIPNSWLRNKSPLSRARVTKPTSAQKLKRGEWCQALLLLQFCYITAAQ